MNDTKHPFWAATEADDHGWESNPRPLEVIDQPNAYVVNEPWLHNKKHGFAGKNSNKEHIIQKNGFISEMNLATGKKYKFYKECFWAQSSESLSWIPVYLFSTESHARAFLSKAEARFSSRDSYLNTAPELATDEPYKVLGVDRGATRAQIKRAFRERARHLHPDAGGDPDAFKSLVEAYGALMAR